MCAFEWNEATGNSAAVDVLLLHIYLWPLSKTVDIVLKDVSRLRRFRGHPMRFRFGRSDDVRQGCSIVVDIGYARVSVIVCVPQPGILCVQKPEDNSFRALLSV